MKVAFAFGAVPIVVLLTCVCAFAQTALSPEESAHQIDWKALGSNPPIPEQMPDAVQSDDPWEAGFAREWIQLLQAPKPGSLGSQGRDLALAISSQYRSPDDEWAAQMEEELREIVEETIPRGRHTRVFCNSLGCLCYVEREWPGQRFGPNALVVEGVIGKLVAKKRLGLQRSYMWFTFGHVPLQWELTIVQRPPPANAEGASTDRPQVPP